METELQEVELPDPGARIQEIFEAFAAKGARGTEQPATFLFMLDGTAGGSHLLRLDAGSVRWEHAYEGPADVTIKLTVDDFLAIADGTFDGRLAVASERIELSGNLEFAEALLGWIEPEEAG